MERKLMVIVRGGDTQYKAGMLAEQSDIETWNMYVEKRGGEKAEYREATKADILAA